MYRIGIITASDKGSLGMREDKSAQVIREMIASFSWKVALYKIVPDNLADVKQTLLKMTDEEKVDLIFTTGGTGLGPRDNTPEATKAIIDKEVPGIAEVMRWESMKKTPRAMLSRAVAGIRNQTLIINLPGSPKAVRECLEAILPALPHGLDILSRNCKECGEL